MSIEAFKDGRDAAYAEIRTIIHHLGGTGAAEEYAQGWDEALSELERQMERQQKINLHWTYNPTTGKHIDVLEHYAAPQPSGETP